MNTSTRICCSLFPLALLACTSSKDDPPITGPDVSPIVKTETQESEMITEGRKIFRYDTFGNEAFWGEKLRLHEAVATLSPKAALGVGLKVDSESLPAPLVAELRAGRVDLDDPAVTAQLLKLNAVVGVTGHFEGDRLRSIGIQCALCHSTVDDSFAPGIGRRLDGWPNRDLDVGKIVSLAPDLSPYTQLLGVDTDTVKRVLTSWGPGKFDAALTLDGQAARPDGKPAATLIPPAYGLAGVNMATFTGWGGVPHWNSLVAILEMHGQGNFEDARLNDPRFPVAQRNQLYRVRAEVDRVTPKLPALHAYQMSLQAPAAPAPADPAAVERGRALFLGNARCGSCHMPPTYTDAGWNMHAPDEIGIDDFQAKRSPDGRYRTTPLAGLGQRTKGGYYHDGRFASLGDVVDHYDGYFSLSLDAQQKADLVAFLGSL